MKLDGLFEREFTELKLRKVKLKTDPKKPLLEYEGYILGEKSKFAPVCEDLLKKLTSNSKQNNVK